MNASPLLVFAGALFAPLAVSASMVLPTFSGGVPVGLEGDFDNDFSAIYNPQSEQWVVEISGAVSPAPLGDIIEDSVWVKRISLVPYQDPTSGNWVSLNPGDELLIRETILLTPGSELYPITDWHELLIGGAWNWAEDGHFWEANQGSLLSTLVLNEQDLLIFDLAVDVLEFKTTPLGTGAMITIEKRAVFGLDEAVALTPTIAHAYSLLIYEFPTIPEPSTVLLLLAGVVGVAFWWRRRR